MAGDVETGSTSSKSNSKAVNQLTDTLANGLKAAYKPGGTTYVAPSQTTLDSWTQALSAAGNQDYANGLTGALQSYGNRAAGNEIGLDDPLYAAQRARLSDSVLTDVNGLFTGSGRFGSGSHVTNAVDSLTSALAPVDLAQRAESYGLQSQAADKLSSLYQASLLPSSVTGAIGAAKDADAQAKANGNLDYINRFLAGLTGAASAAGEKSTSSMPFWQVGLGTALAASGK